jgi:hypothetical protein
MWYSYLDTPYHLLAIPVENVINIIAENKKGIFPEKLEDFAYISEQKTDYESFVAQDDLTRFDHL